jgi:hypothetical protein
MKRILARWSLVKKHNSLVAVPFRTSFVVSLVCPGSFTGPFMSPAFPLAIPAHKSNQMASVSICTLKCSTRGVTKNKHKRKTHTVAWASEAVCWAVSHAELMVWASLLEAASLLLSLKFEVPRTQTDKLDEEKCQCALGSYTCFRFVNNRLHETMRIVPSVWN